MSDEITPLIKEDGQSKDLVNENIEKLKQLFPEIVTDGKIDFETLKEELGEFRETSDERYSFTWNGKSKARKLAMEPSRGTLRPAPEESVNWGDTKHIFIEGDNLEVLKLLQRGYHKKVKIIYLDPPYNTGNDFIYSDDYKDNLRNYLNKTGQLNEDGEKISSNPEYSGRYHTDWLNMMYPRLKLAKELLKEDGIIFISIDDNEAANLKKMCDQIFGEDNFIEQVVWKNKYGSGALTKGFANVHEYILCYSNGDFQNLEAPLDEEDIAKYNKRDEKYETRGGYITQPLMTTSKDDRPNLQYTIEHEGEVIEPKKQWIWSEERLKKAIDNNEVVFNKMDNGEWSVRSKQYLRDEDGVMRKSKPVSIFEGPFNQEGTKEIKKLFGKKVFDFPKPMELIKYLISFTLNGEENENEIFLDFFAGSAPLAHSVLKLNQEENKNNRFICVQLPEKVEKKTALKNGYNAITDIGKERIRRVIKSIKEKSPEFDGDLGFKVFKLDSSNIKPWDPTFDNVQLSIEDSIENVKPDRSELDLLYEVLLKYGIDLSLPIEERTVDGSQVYIGGAGALVLCPSDTITLEVVEGIAEIKEEFNPEIMRVVFRDSGFKDDVVKTNAIQILKQHGIEDVKSI